MNCKKCGATLQTGAKFCENCGTAVEEIVENNNIAQPSGAVTPMQTTNKKNDYIFIIVIVVIGIALIAVPILMNLDKIKDQSNKKENGILDTNSSGINSSTNSNNYFNTNSNSNINSNHNQNTNTNSGSNSTNTSGKRVTLGNYTLLLPKNAETEIEEDTLMFDHLRTADDIGYIVIQEGYYDDIKTSKEILQQYLQASTDEYDIGKFTVSTYNGVEFIVVPLSQDGMTMLCGFAKLTDDELVMVMVLKYDYTADYTLFNEMATIVKSIEKVGASGM